MIAALLFTALFACSGLGLSEVVFSKHRFINRIWLGLTLGLLLLTWLPALFAFFIGFTLLSQLLAAACALLGLVVCFVILYRRRKRGRKNAYSLRTLSPALLLLIPVALIGVVLLNTHVLYPHRDGSLWVGQVTYGDLAMHLGFLTSIAEQKAFPPQYSIFPGHALNYPFLCETSGASLYALGATARQAYLISAIYAFLLVVLGVYCFMKQWLKKENRAVLATLLFFFGGGFGFFYFFDLAKSGGILTNLLDTGAQTVSQTLLDGFYQTPTNIPALGLRWVNPIVDMLIPQRATLFGWAFLFPCLYLLHGFAFERRRGNVIMLGVTAGLLPLIHTHSFLALGIISAVYCLSDLVRARFEKKRLLEWLCYALIACVLAAPQLFFFSFRQAAESSLVRVHLNWGNTTDSYLWFYVKNMGFIFALMPFAYLILPKKDRRIYNGVLVLWLISEILEFQPNDYDNNKLLFIWFAFTCAIDAKLLCWLYQKGTKALRVHRHAERTLRGNLLGISALCGLFFIYFLCKRIAAKSGQVLVPAATSLTLFFLAGFLLTLILFTAVSMRKKISGLLCILPALLLAILLLSLIAVVWLEQYTQTSYAVSDASVYALMLLSAAGLIVPLLNVVLSSRLNRGFAGGGIARALAAYLLVFTMFVSSVMTILREWKSEYQVYSAEEVALTEQIKATSEPDAVILANSYHWNLVTPLTGRSIVTGTGTFLYYHGIDVSERTEHVRQMYETPAQCEDLFSTYHVGYVLISNAERMNYEIDEAYFDSHGTVVAENEAGLLYRLNLE